MLIEKTTRHSLRFNLHNAEERESYDRWLNDPSVKILDKKHEKIKQSEFHEDFSTTTEELWVYLEVERCSL